MFLHACLHSSFCLVTQGHIKDTNNISDDNNGNGTRKELQSATAFYYQLTSVHMQNIAPSHGVLPFWRNTHKQISFL